MLNKKQEEQQKLNIEASNNTNIISNENDDKYKKIILLIFLCVYCFHSFINASPMNVLFWILICFITMIITFYCCFKKEKINYD